MPILKKYRPLLVGAALVAMAAPVLAQDDGANSPVPRATAYEEVTQWPDWNGIWYQDWSKLFGVPAAPPKLTDKARAELDAWNEKYEESGPPLDKIAQCIPPGMPEIMSVGGMPMEILYSPGRITIALEAYSQVRRIYMDGRPLPEEPDLFFNGNSVGHWEGDVLVIETVGLHPLNDLVRGGGVAHSEQARIDERIYQPAPGQLIVEQTISDPEIFEEPYVNRIYYKLDNEFPIREYVCTENNRLVSDGENPADIDFGLDEE
jgi:hypothetical protein